MGLFGKKDPCAICGGTVKGLFPWKIEGQLICKECYGHVHLPEGVVDSMTLEEFKKYRAFREENDVVRQQFKATQQIGFGFLGEYFQFDENNGLLCASIETKSTIFERKNIKSFVIREDNELLFEGSAAGLVCYNSTVTDRVIAMTPMIQQRAMLMAMKRQADRIADKMDDDQRDYRDYELNSSYSDIPKPFEKFILEIKCEHPYWRVLTADKNAPGFNNSYPDADEYLRLYRSDVENMEKFARALMSTFFPDAPEQRVDRNSAPSYAVNNEPSADVVAEIQRFKELMDLGILTEEEFTAKKRKLLGI